MDNSHLDTWAQWLLHRRHGGDPEELRQVLEYLHPVRDRVLANTRLASGETLLDVGCGDGLIAFGALDKVGQSGTVVCSDISQDLLTHVRALAEEMDVLDRSQFVHASAEDLGQIGDNRRADQSCPIMMQPASPPPRQRCAEMAIPAGRDRRAKPRRSHRAARR